MRSGRLERLKLVFCADSIKGLQALDLVVRILNDFGFPSVFSLQGVEVDVATLEKKIQNKKSWPSGVASNNFEFRFGTLPALDQCFLVVEEVQNFDGFDWDQAVRPFLDVEGFIQAWLADVEYDFWQNATDPLEYECAGRSFAKLPLKSSGLPAPLNQMEIDTSVNPGRVLLRQGFMEAIGSFMWLGDQFWERTGRNKLESLTFLRRAGVSIFECGSTVKVVASEKCFHDDLTADKQRVLRRALFGVS
ncbi:hypothetical protein [Pseudomonas sp. Z2-11]